MHPSGSRLLVLLVVACAMMACGVAAEAPSSAHSQLASMHAAHTTWWLNNTHAARAYRWWMRHTTGRRGSAPSLSEPTPMPTPTPSAPTPKPPTDSGGEASISDLAEGTPMLSTLVAALESQGLLETLMTGGPYTVFAPNDAAFEKLIKSLGGDPGTFLDDPPPFLGGVLKYHVVPGIFKVGDLENGQELTTLQGEKIIVTIEREALGGAFKVNGRNLPNNEVITADIDATNGVVHVIDEVLLPPSIVKKLAG